MTVDRNVFQAMLAVFEAETPPTVMAALVMEHAFSAKQLDALFDRVAQRQYTRELCFSTVVELMVAVVTNARSSVNRAFLQRKEQVGVAIQSLYNKLNAMEDGVSEALLEHVARRCSALIDAMPGSSMPSILGTIPVRIADGNHLYHTHRRLGVMDDVAAAVLPGWAIVLLDPQRNLVDELILERDAHAQERARFDDVIAAIRVGECLIADRNFCTKELLIELCGTDRYVLIRHHAGLGFEPQGERKELGRCDGGRLYEQRVKVIQDANRSVVLRRITIQLDEPTRHGEHELHLLTNLPDTISAELVARAFRTRWSIETMFQQLEALLHSEVETLGHPKAALFAFSVAVCAFNVLSTVKAALGAVHGVEKVRDTLSDFAVAEEVRGAWRGVQVLLVAAAKVRAQPRTTREVADELLRVASHFSFHAYTKSKRGPKKPKKPRTGYTSSPHVATQRLLDSKNSRKSCGNQLPPDDL